MLAVNVTKLVQPYVTDHPLRNSTSGTDAFQLPGLNGILFHQFTIDGPNFLQAWILHTKGVMLTVCIGLVAEHTKFQQHCASSWQSTMLKFTNLPSLCVQSFWQVALSMMSLEALQVLEELSILSESASDYLLNPKWPQLDMVLVANATNTFPNEQLLWHHANVTLFGVF